MLSIFILFFKHIFSFWRGWVSNEQMGHGLLSTLQRDWKRNRTCRSHCIKTCSWLTDTLTVFFLHWRWPCLAHKTENEQLRQASRATATHGLTGHGCCELQGKTRKNFIRPAQPPSCARKGQGQRPTEQDGHSNCRIHLPGRLSFLVAGHPSSEDHCATSYTSALFLLRAFTILFDGVVNGHVNCNHIHSMRTAEKALEWKDIHGHVPDCMLNMAHTTSGTSLLRDCDVTDSSYHFQWG